jgi:Tol biopolymer transport system component
MKSSAKFFVLITSLIVVVPGVSAADTTKTEFLQGLHAPRETHLSNVRQLTTEQAAEAYFSFDDKKIIFQSRRSPYQCDQQYIMNADGTDLRLLSNGLGQTTCGHFFPDGSRVIYSSTHAAGESCPEPVPPGAIWKFWEGFDVYSAKPDGSDLKRLTFTAGYDAEDTMSPDGTRIVFTSVRNGNPDIYVMDPDGANVQQLTYDIGDNGGAWFSHDNEKIVYRCFHPRGAEQIRAWRESFARKELGRFPHEICMMNADGSNKIELTNFGAASWAPYFHPDGETIIFSSNMDGLSNGQPWNFEIYTMNLDGSNLERVTYHGGADLMPMFSYDGRQLVWISTRNSASQETAVDTVFIADWLP